ncbi:efflux transporter outer membrane subunit [Paraburkholderia sp. MM5384-R2]|uniref:efflux transporter outer membrane subunit n=1 Tax=Paraburkholderia sp. MM5384-R2 TaxID=2723097 RepID=UPI0017CE764F|nr:efflux transporter outer membrane subunit [Paraburkholderia sp. MM5384-R2]MBB5499353.1 NodT family efflux transporter outer membrane factor (OMF) lipoprotein [Paraburkholderia sp. MM5384-R2]
MKIRFAPTGKVAALLIAAVLAGCTVGPDYHLPAKAAFNAAGSRAPFVGAANSSAVVQDSLPSQWWHMYRSPDLDRLVAAALSENTDLRIANANLERSRAMVDLARSQGQPRLGLDLGYQHAQLSAEQFLSSEYLTPFDIYDAKLSASYELDLFGRIRRGIEAAKADDEAIEAARDWVRVSVAADVTSAYLEVCSTGAELAVAHRSFELQRQSLMLTRQLQEGGRATRLDLTRSQNLVDQIESGIPGIEARQRNALFRLATLTGKPPSEFEAGLTQCVAAPPMDRPIPVGDGTALLKRRPDVRAAERQLAGSTAEIGVATAELYPRVVLGASIGSTGLVSDFLTHPTNLWSIGPGISWELNQSGPRARIAAARAGEKAQLARFDGVVLGALRDVETALNNYTHDLARQKSLEAARNGAANAVADAHLLQVQGRSGALATLDAERVLVSADAALSSVRTQIAHDQVALFLALGGGWENETVAPEHSSVQSRAAVAQ